MYDINKEEKTQAEKELEARDRINGNSLENYSPVYDNSGYCSRFN